MENEIMKKAYQIMTDQINYLEKALQENVPTMEMYMEYKSKLKELKKIKSQLKKMYQL